MLPGTPAFSRICNLSPATLNELRREFDNAVGSVSGAVSRSCSTHPPVSIWDNECHVVVEVDVPGVQQSDLEVSVEDRVLTVSGNRRPSKHGGEPKNLDGRFGKFCRAIKLHESLDTTSIQAELDNGILILSIPRRVESQPRTIPVAIRPRSTDELPDASTD
jgi:HSP20 family protein